MLKYKFIICVNLCEMSKTDDDKIILELKARNFPHLYKNVEKYSSYINHLLGEETDTGFVIEPIEGGLVYIYRNFDIFKALNPGYSKELVEKYANTYEEKVSPQLLTGDVVNEENFPEGGLLVDYIISCEQKERCMDILAEHFRSFVDQDIQIDIYEKNLSHFVLVFQTYAALEFYAHFISSLIDGMIREYFNN